MQNKIEVLKVESKEITDKIKLMEDNIQKNSLLTIKNPQPNWLRIFIIERIF
jgi:hypothetical protein